MVAPAVASEIPNVTLFLNVPPPGEMIGAATVEGEGVTVGVGVGVGVAVGLGVGLGDGVGVGVPEEPEAL